MIEIYIIKTYLSKDSEIKKYESWSKKHSKCYAGAIGGNKTFSITPTGLGDIVKVKCNICDKEYDLTSYDW